MVDAPGTCASIMARRGALAICVVTSALAAFTFLVMRPPALSSTRMDAMDFDSDLSLGADRNALVGDLTTPRTPQQPQINLLPFDMEIPPQDRDPRGYLMMYDGMEGMASWRFSVYEILYFAKALDRTLVVPCVLRGRIVPCHEGDAFPLSSYFSLDSMRRYHRVISFDEFARLHGFDFSDPAKLCSYPLHFFYLCHGGGCTARKAGDCFGVFKATDVDGGYSMRDMLMENNLTGLEELTGSLEIVAFASYRRLGGSLKKKVIIPESERHVMRVLGVKDIAPSILAQAVAFRQAHLGGEEGVYYAYSWRSETTPVERLVSCATRLGKAMKRRRALDYWAARVEKEKGGKGRTKQLKPGGRRYPQLIITDMPALNSSTGMAMWPVGQSPERTRAMHDAMEALEGASGGYVKFDEFVDLRGKDLGVVSLIERALSFWAVHLSTCRVFKGKCSSCARPQSEWVGLLLEDRKMEDKKPSSNDWPLNEKDDMK